MIKMNIDYCYFMDIAISISLVVLLLQVVFKCMFFQKKIRVKKLNICSF